MLFFSTEHNSEHYAHLLNDSLAIWLVGFNCYKGKCFYVIPKENYKNIKQNEFHILIILVLIILTFLCENHPHSWFWLLLTFQFSVLNLVSLSWNPNNCYCPPAKGHQVVSLKLGLFLMQQGILGIVVISARECWSMAVNEIWFCLRWFGEVSRN